MAARRAMQKAKDPVMQMQQQEMQIKQAEVQRKAAKDQADAAVDKEKLDIERTKVEIDAKEKGIKIAKEKRDADNRLDMDIFKTLQASQDKARAEQTKAMSEANKLRQTAAMQTAKPQPEKKEK